jgi:Leucine-rich repeat (LRR) protein
MKTLTIKDLARTEQLDRAALSAVRGGTKMSSPSYSFGDVSYTPSYDSSLHATQNLAQIQHVVNATANGSAFIDGVHATNNTSLFGQNNIVAGS